MVVTMTAYIEDQQAVILANGDQQDSKRTNIPLL